MRFGLWTNIDGIQQTIEAGFDYLEIALSQIAKLDEQQFEDLRIRLESSPVKCEVCNIMLPGGSLSLYDRCHDELLQYIIGAFNRASQLGVEQIVFGSGKARMHGENISKEHAWDTMVKFARMVGDKAGDITIVVEPLNLTETNTINSIAEGIAFVKNVNHPNVALLADFYHMRMENENMNELLKTEKLIKHTHIAKNIDRTFPLSVDEDIYTEFFAMLKQLGYNGRMSIEAKTRDFANDAPASLKLLRRLAMEAYRS